MNGGLINWYNVMPKKFLNKSDNPNYSYHGLSSVSRHLLVGGSGTGKTQLLLNLIKVFSDKSKNKKRCWNI